MLLAKFGTTTLSISTEQDGNYGKVIVFQEYETSTESYDGVQFWFSHNCTNYIALNRIAEIFLDYKFFVQS